MKLFTLEDMRNTVTHDEIDDICEAHSQVCAEFVEQNGGAPLTGDALIHWRMHLLPMMKALQDIHDMFAIESEERDN